MPQPCGSNVKSRPAAGRPPDGSLFPIAAHRLGDAQSFPGVEESSSRLLGGGDTTGTQHPDTLTRPRMVGLAAPRQCLDSGTLANRSGLAEVQQSVDALCTNRIGQSPIIVIDRSQEPTFWKRQQGGFRNPLLSTPADRHTLSQPLHRPKIGGHVCSALLGGRHLGVKTNQHVPMWPLPGLAPSIGLAARTTVSHNASMALQSCDGWANRDALDRNRLATGAT
jgi:hypothetical protein